MVIKTEVIIDVDVKSSVNRKQRGNFINSAMASIHMSDNKKLIVCCFGIFICYFYYGILQEKITRTTYGDNHEKFTFQQTLVCMQCIVNAAFAYLVIKSTHDGTKDDTPTLMYLWCSISYMGAMLASNMALRYVNYPTQVLGKSCKPIPVMILGVLLARKRYPLMKYICVLFIVLGVALFFYKDKKGAAQVESTGYGELLLLLSLTLDGMTGASQEKMRSQHKTQAHSMMYAVNKYSIFILGSMVLLSGEIFEFVGFVSRYPYLLWNMFLFGLTSALGQNFIFLTVANFGPLTCSVVTTTRKFFTILFSILFFGNAITTRQSFAVVLVFIGLGLDARVKKPRRFGIKPTVNNTNTECVSQKS